MIREDVLERISEKYNSLTRAEKRVADYVLENRVEVQYMSITSLAAEVGLAEATIFRFCRTLEFTGYNDFKLALAKATIPSSHSDQMYDVYGKVKPEDSISDMCKKLYNSEVDALTQTLQLMDPERLAKAADILWAARRVHCMGQGGSVIIAMEAFNRFLMVSPKFHCIEDSHMQAMAASLLDEQDAILFFSYSGTTKDMADVLPAAKARGVKTVLVTRFPQSDAVAHADVVLLCGSREGPLQMGSVAAKVAQLYIVDVLFNEFCRRDMDRAIASIERSTKSLANKLL